MVETKTVVAVAKCSKVENWDLLKQTAPFCIFVL